MKYHIQIIYDDENPNRILVNGDSHNRWLDLGILIEAVGTMMGIEANDWQNPKGIKTKEELVVYVKSYIDKVAKDYGKSFEIKAEGN